MPIKQIKIAVLMDAKGNCEIFEFNEYGDVIDDDWNDMSERLLMKGPASNTAKFIVTADIPIPDDFGIATIAASKVEEAPK